MKKVIALLTVFFIFILAGTAIYADGIDIESDSGDHVSIFGDVAVDQPTEGNAVAILGGVNIHAAVQGDVVAIGGRVNADSEISGEIVSVLGGVSLGEKALAGGSVVAIGGDMELHQDVKGDVVAVFGDIYIHAKVSGEVIAVFGKVKLGENAVVQGDVFSLGGIEKSEGAKVNGTEREMFAGAISGHSLLFGVAMMIVALSLMNLLIGWIVLLISKERFGSIAATLEADIGKKITSGFLAFLAICLVSLLLSITVVVPLLFILFLMYVGVASSMYFGRLILKNFVSGNNVYAEFITGLITVTLVKIMLVYVIQTGSILLNLALYLLFAFFLNSLGTGMLLMSKRIYGNGKTTEQI